MKNLFLQLNRKIFIFSIISLIFSTKIEAKELELILENKQSNYPIDVHYKFSSGNQIYGSGYLYKIKKGDKYYISVNRIPDNKDVLVQIDKISVQNRIVFNDPCEIYLFRNELKANIVVGLKGNIKTHGLFTCFISKPTEK